MIEGENHVLCTSGSISDMIIDPVQNGDEDYE